MDFKLTSDQDALVSAIDKLAQQFELKPTEFHGFALVGHELEKELEDGQYFDIAQVPELGALGAAMAVERLARLPCATEIALSMLVRPELPGEWPRPLAVIENGRPGRFVAAASRLMGIAEVFVQNMASIEAAVSMTLWMSFFALLTFSSVSAMIRQCRSSSWLLV